MKEDHVRQGQYFLEYLKFSCNPAREGCKNEGWTTGVPVKRSLVPALDADFPGVYLPLTTATSTGDGIDILLPSVQIKKLYGGAFGSKMQLDRNLHLIGSYCLLFVRELYAIRSCLYAIRSYTPSYRTEHSVVLPIRSYRAFGRTPHSIVPSIRSYSPFDRTEHSVVPCVSFGQRFNKKTVASI